jgi:twitching motility protein PilT
MKPISHFLRECVERGGSDVHFKTDTGKIYVRINGDLQPMESETYTNEEFSHELNLLLNYNQQSRFENDLELDFAIEVEGLSRFRGNAHCEIRLRGRGRDGPVGWLVGLLVGWLVGWVGGRW